MITDAMIRMMPNRLRLWIVDQLTQGIEATMPHDHEWQTGSCWGGRHDARSQGTLGFDRWCRVCRRREHLGY